MILGIGNDVIEIERFLNVREDFKEGFFTKREVEESKGRIAFLAANFSVKESVGKAFGTGIRGFEGNEIEVLRDDIGKPYVKLYGDAKKLSEKLGVDNIFVSISDTKSIVMTMAVIEKL